MQPLDAADAQVDINWNTVTTRHRTRPEHACVGTSSTGEETRKLHF